MKSYCLSALWALTLIALCSCSKDENPVDSPLSYRAEIAVPFADYADTLRICTWRNSRRAAYSIAFDDATRSSHYLVSAPELEARGLRGTFNLNTKDIVDWEPWQKLFDKGHELASHGWSHVRMGELDETTLHAEFSRAKSDLLKLIKGMKEVPSFTFPNGSASPLARAIALQYHLSARVGGGINAANFSQEELSRVNGIGVYAPYVESRFEPFIHQVIAKGGWVLFYFHTVSAAGDSGETTTPLALFRQHLDFVKARSDSFWFATQGEVATYITARTGTELGCAVKEERILAVTLNAPNFREAAETTLSIIVPKPAEWLNHRIVVEEEGAVLSEFGASAAAQLVCDLPVNKTVWIWARK
ncbi:MAG TPA: polysaccharide deacetylase family protein [bacterium]|nr:polysaccharide deacetylase family protein [bacterium]